MKNFEKKVRVILDLTCQNGIDNTAFPKEAKSLKEIPEDILKQFQKNVHEGFRKGQQLVIEEMLVIQNQTKELKSKLKVSRREKDKQKELEYQEEIRKNEFKEVLLRNVMDTIAFQLLGGQYWQMRAFYSGNKGKPNLSSSNIESLHLIAEQLYKEDPDGFVLYSDLTSFIDISDLIHISSRGELRPIEVKQGDVNKKVFDFIEDISKEKNPLDDKELLKLKDHKKFFDQVERAMKQFSKGSMLNRFMADEGGEHPFSNLTTNVSEAVLPNEYYFDFINQLFEGMQEMDFEFGVFQNIIYVGVYKGKFVSTSRTINERLLKDKFGLDYPFFDFGQQIYLPIKEPFVMKPFQKDLLFDILFARLKIYLLIDFEELIKLFNSMGVPAGWMSRKETHKYIDDYQGKAKPFTYNHRAIWVESNVGRLVLGDQMVSKLVFDCIKPSLFVNTYKHLKS